MQKSNIHSSKKQEPYGSALEHGKAHQQSHQQWSRRSFLRNLGIAGSTSFLLGQFPVTAMAASPLSMALNNSENDNILVLIRMQGGNDGLNTIIPVFDYGTYQAARPTIRIPQDQIINLNNSFGMPNTMEALENLWLDGSMKVVNSVGYPNQNLSHFRSTDIWTTASDADVNDTTGWLGRLLEYQYPDFISNPPEVPPAIQIGGAGTFLFQNSDSLNMAVTVNDPEELYEIAQNGELYDAVNVPECYYGEQLSFVRTVANSTFRYAEVIADTYSNASNAVEYGNGLGEQLALVARLIKGGLGTRLYMVTINGFDTHANQPGTHPQLMLQLSTAIRDFYADLGAGGEAHRVLAMTFSEFGRRIEQNASNGTDHGAAAPLLLFGQGLNGSDILGTNPDLTNVDGVGNLIYGTDFRQIYATLLENWLCIDSGTVDDLMGQSFERMPELGISCTATSTYAPAIPAIQHWASYEDGQVNIQYTLPSSMPVTVQIYTILGQPVQTLFNGQQMAGTHQHSFASSNARLANGIYIYTIKAGAHTYSQKIRIVKR